MLKCLESLQSAQHRSSSLSSYFSSAYRGMVKVRASANSMLRSSISGCHHDVSSVWCWPDAEGFHRLRRIEARHVLMSRATCPIVLAESRQCAVQLSMSALGH